MTPECAYPRSRFATVESATRRGSATTTPGGVAKWACEHAGRRDAGSAAPCSSDGHARASSKPSERVACVRRLGRRSPARTRSRAPDPNGSSETRMSRPACPQAAPGRRCSRAGTIGRRSIIATIACTTRPPGTVRDRSGRWPRRPRDRDRGDAGGRSARRRGAARARHLGVDPDTRPAPPERNEVEHGLARDDRRLAAPAPGQVRGLRGTPRRRRSGRSRRGVRATDGAARRSARRRAAARGRRRSRDGRSAQRVTGTSGGPASRWPSPAGSVATRFARAGRGVWRTSAIAARVATARLAGVGCGGLRSRSALRSRLRRRAAPRGRRAGGGRRRPAAAWRDLRREPLRGPFAMHRPARWAPDGPPTLGRCRPDSSHAARARSSTTCPACAGCRSCSCCRRPRSRCSPAST